jgi:hypothetical protein
MAYEKTGFPRGRPRKGELRPASPNAENQARWRAKNAEYYRVINRNYQSEWVAANPERAREIKRNTYLRKKLWEKDQEVKKLAEKADLILRMTR